VIRKKTRPQQAIGVAGSGEEPAMNEMRRLMEAVNPLFENWEETSWSDTMPDGTEVTVTIQDIMKLAGEPQKMNPQQFASVRIQPESEERMMKADLKYPLLVLQHRNGKYQVLDGNHRLAKALHIKQPDVLVRMVKFDSLPEQWQWLFNPNR